MGRLTPCEAQASFGNHFPKWFGKQFPSTFASWQAREMAIFTSIRLMRSNEPATAAHTAIPPVWIGHFSVRHLPLAQLKARDQGGKVARKLREFRVRIPPVRSQAARLAIQLVALQSHFSGRHHPLPPGRNKGTIAKNAAKGGNRFAAICSNRAQEFAADCRPANPRVARC